MHCWHAEAESWVSTNSFNDAHAWIWNNEHETDNETKNERIWPGEMWKENKKKEECERPKMMNDEHGQKCTANVKICKLKICILIKWFGSFAEWKVL